MGSLRWGGLAAAGVLACAVSAGCLDRPVSTCADGRICPPGTLCNDVHDRCVTQAQVDICDGRDDGFPCRYPGQGEGACDNGVCLPIDCGNGELEAGERCDDGNTDGGDGCSANCQSDETCGNDVVDTAVGEACDDGGTDDGDGCSASCLVELCGDGVRDATEECDDGNVAAGDGCGPACLVEACGNAFVDPGEACDDGNVAAGDGCGPTCLIEICGNDYLDPGELCDDGNTVGGDGCSPDCISLEACGNHYTDFTAGETCDDGNFLSRDGCSSACELEVYSWDELVPPEMPSRTGESTVFDAGRGRVVLFGGVHDNIAGFLVQEDALADTWEWAGHQWVKIPTETAPPPREGALLAYDGRAGRVILHGGHDFTDNPGIDYDDFWAYDGRNWTEISQPGDPSGVVRMVFDPGRGRLIAVTATDTWELDGGSWTATSAAAPTGFLYYDTLRQTTATLSGSEIWTFDGSGWSLAETLAQPAPATATLYYDVTAARLIAVTAAETVALQGGSWTSIAGGAPSPRTVAYDSARQRAVLFSCAQDAETDCNRQPTWELDGVSWLSIQEPVSPPGMTVHNMVEDPWTGSPVVLGGGVPTYNDGYYPAIWRLVGDSWQQLTHPLPAPLAAAGGAFDQRRRRAVFVYQDLSNNGDPPITRIWNGISWLSYTPTTGPPSGVFPRMTYDAGRDRMMVLVGFDSSGQALAMQLWELDGGTWLAGQTGAVTPRALPAMAYDPARSVIALFGGITQDAAFADIWLYDGAQWTSLSTSTVPAARGGAAMAFDPRTGELIMLMGNDQSVTGSVDDQPWLFDGTDWREVNPIGSQPAPRAFPTAMYDRAGRRLVLFGGGGFFGDNPDETHSLSLTSNTPDESCADGADDDGDGLVDCADPDCRDDPRCPELDCGDGLDNDGDLLTDCADRGCDQQLCAPDSLCYRGACQPCPVELGRDAVYTACTSSSAFEDISATGTLLGSDDDASWPIDLPFEVSLYAEVAARITIQSNGAITFRDGLLGPTNQCLPAHGPGGGPIVAALWDDLRSADTADAIYYEIRGEPHDRRVIVQWDMRPQWGAGPPRNAEPGSVQAVLHQATGHVELRYRDVQFGNPDHDLGASASVGILAGAAGPAVPLSCNAANLSDGASYVFYRRRGPR